MKLVLNGVNTTFSFLFTYGEDIKTEFYKPSSSYDLETISFDYEQGYSGTITIKTKDGGDYFYIVKEKNENDYILINLHSFKDLKGEIVDVNYKIIEEIIFDLKFNPNYKDTRLPHYPTMVISIK